MDMRNNNTLEKRVTELFLQLTSIDSVSFRERKMAAVLKTALTELGFEVTEDDAAERLDSEAGNVYGILRGDPAKKPVLFSAHMDTVEPGLGKVPVMSEDGDMITSDGETVLGADDVSGIVEILEGIRLAVSSDENGDTASHGDIEVLFTAAEEAYAKGAHAFDYSRLISEEAYVLDMSGAPGKAARKAPSIISFEAKIRGKAAHAGFAPEEGVNALKAGAEAITRIRQGHISENTTFNVGTIQAGTADNIVADLCTCTGEARGFDHNEAMAQISRAEEIFRQEAEKAGASLGFTHTVHITAYETPEDAPVIQCFRKACDALGLERQVTSTLGGSDNNPFVEHGLSGIVLASGMYNTHTTKEYTYARDLAAGARLVAEIIKNR